MTRCAGAREGFAEHAERVGGLGTSSLVRKKVKRNWMIGCQKIEIVNICKKDCFILSRCAMNG